jgi:ABC-2 type transport system ATP-binding protein
MDGNVAEGEAPAAIAANGLVKRFGQTLAVDGIDLRVGESEFFGFLGPNGAGKSTTIKMLCGLLRPDAGAVCVAGHDLQQDPIEVKRVIGVLPEETNLYERLSGQEFLLFSGRMYGLSQEEARRRTADLLDLMELEDAKDKLIVDYSMGMKKKTALAAAIIHRPRVMFMDEPFNGIDPISVRAIRQILRQLTDRGTTIFFSSHVMEVVERLCTRVAIINHGRIVGEGTIGELRSKAEAGGDSSLEDIFLKLVEARVDEEALSWL